MRCSVISLAADSKSMFTDEIPSSLPFVPETTTGTEDLLIKSLFLQRLYLLRNDTIHLFT